MTRRVVALGVLAAVAAPMASPARAAAQAGPRFAIAASAAEVFVRGASSSGTTSLRGPVFGGEARVGWGPLFLRAGYDQGSLSPTGGGLSRDLVEAYAALGTRPIGGLLIAVGPYARAYPTDSTTQRWIYWEVRVGYETGLGVPWAHAYGEVWGIVSGSVNVAESMTGGRGGTAGLRARVGAFTVGLGYAIDEARFGTSARRETVQEIRLSAGVGAR